MYRNRKGPDGSYVVHLDGEDLIITKAMIDATDPQIMREYLRMLWAQEHRERREERCRDARGVPLSEALPRVRVVPQRQAYLAGSDCGGRHTTC